MTALLICLHRVAHDLIRLSLDHQSDALAGYQFGFERLAPKRHPTQTGEFIGQKLRPDDVFDFVAAEGPLKLLAHQVEVVSAPDFWRRQLQVPVENVEQVAIRRTSDQVTYAMLTQV
jgi:hypothetical protein